MLNSVLISIISVAVILGFMILIHEFGHYAVAKLLGVRVEFVEDPQTSTS